MGQGHANEQVHEHVVKVDALAINSSKDPRSPTVKPLMTAHDFKILEKLNRGKAVYSVTPCHWSNQLTKSPTYEWYGMVWYGAPSTPVSVFCHRGWWRHAASIVSEQHREAVQSALVRKWVRPCDAGIGKRKGME
jgi:hypothetical protein